MPTTIDKIHKQAKKEEEEMQRRIAHQQMMGRPRGGIDGRRGRDDWPSVEHSSRPAPPTKIDTERFSRVMARSAGVSWCGKVVLKLYSLLVCAYLIVTRINHTTVILWSTAYVNC